MTTPTIAQQRLYYQRISHSKFQNPGEVVRWLGALQAQDYASAEWTIGLRLPGTTHATIEQAIIDRTLVRTWLLRGTLHLVTADDVRWMLALLAPTLLARFAPYHRQLELDAATVARSYDVIAKTLIGGKQLTRKELLAALANAGIVMEGMRASNLLNCLALDGLICLGAMRGKQPTFALLEEWIPSSKVLARAEALSELALRYFTSHGPTTLQDFAWWTGLLMVDAKAGLEAVKSQLVEETIEGKRYWRAPTTAPLLDSSPTVYLLPGFDEYILGYADRSVSLEAQHKKMITGVNAIFAYTMILDGRVVGIWKRTFHKGAVTITFSPFVPLPPTVQQAFATVAQRYGEFLKMPVQMG